MACRRRCVFTLVAFFRLHSIVCLFQNNFHICILRHNCLFVTLPQCKLCCALPNTCSKLRKFKIFGPIGRICCSGHQVASTKRAPCSHQVGTHRPVGTKWAPKHFQASTSSYFRNITQDLGQVAFVGGTIFFSSPFRHCFDNVWQPAVIRSKKIGAICKCW